MLVVNGVMRTGGRLKRTRMSLNDVKTVNSTKLASTEQNGENYSISPPQNLGIKIMLLLVLN